MKCTTPSSGGAASPAGDCETRAYKQVRPPLEGPRGRCATITASAGHSSQPASACTRRDVAGRSQCGVSPACVWMPDELPKACGDSPRQNANRARDSIHNAPGFERVRLTPGFRCESTRQNASAGRASFNSVRSCCKKHQRAAAATRESTSECLRRAMQARIVSRCFASFSHFGSRLAVLPLRFGARSRRSALT